MAYLVFIRQDGIERNERAFTAAISRGWLEQSDAANCRQHHARIDLTDLHVSIQRCSAASAISK